MAGCLILFLVVGLEVLCAIVGMVLPDSGTPRDVHSLWVLALISIPATGLGAAFLTSRARIRRNVALIIAAIGGALALYWGRLGVISKFDQTRFAAGLISSMAFMSALLLLTAAIRNLMQPGEQIG